MCISLLEEVNGGASHDLRPRHNSVLRRPSPIIEHTRYSNIPCVPKRDTSFDKAVVICEIKLFQNYFGGIGQLMNVFQHVFNVVEISLK